MLLYFLNAICSACNLLNSLYPEGWIHLILIQASNAQFDDLLVMSSFAQAPKESDSRAKSPLKVPNVSYTAV